MAKHGIRKNKTNNKIKKIITKIILFLIILFFVFRIFSKPKNKEIELIIDNEKVTQDLSNKLYNIDNTIFMSYEDIKKYIDNTIYNENDNLIITTSNRKVACIEFDSNVININGTERQISSGAITLNQKTYLPISELKDVYNIDFNYSDKSNIVIIDNLEKEQVTENAKKKVSVKIKQNLFSKTLTKVKKDEEVIFLSEEGKWTRVRTNDGYIGFIKTKKLTNKVIKRENFIEEVNILTNDALKEDIRKQDISNFKNRMNLIQKIFTEAIKNDKMQIKFILDSNNEYSERFKIEANPIFKECGIYCEFEQQ